MMVGVRAGRVWNWTKIWGYVGKKQKRVQRHEISHKGDQYTFIGMSALLRHNHQLPHRQAR